MIILFLSLQCAKCFIESSFLWEESDSTTDPKTKIRRKTRASSPADCRISSSDKSHACFTHPAEGTKFSRANGCFSSCFFPSLHWLSLNISRVLYTPLFPGSFLNTEYSTRNRIANPMLIPAEVAKSETSILLKIPLLLLFLLVSSPSSNCLILAPKTPL